MRNKDALILISAVGLIAFLQSKWSFMPSVETQGSDFYRYDSLFKSAGSRYSVPWRWLKAIAWNESDLGRDRRVIAGAVSGDGLSYGLMQFTIPTARDFLGFALTEAQIIQKLNDPATSVELAAQYIRNLLRMFSGDRRKAIMSYNQGPGNTQKGKEYAAEYYTRFVKHLASIMEAQPGNEME